MGAIAVFDVGKTNKKLLIYDESLAVIDQAYTPFPADESDPVHVEDLDGMEAWFLDRLKEAASKHDIQVVAVTTHGATAATIDRDGNRALPLVAYTTDPGEDFHERFFALCGDARALHRELATPPLGGLTNLAQGILYWKEHFGAAFDRVWKILPFPQYFAFRLTGRPAADTTYLGCHSYLYDFRTGGYSRVVDALGIRDRLPDRIAPSGEVLGSVSPAMAERTGLSTETRVVHGIHDSNASLLPFLIQSDEPFVLNSTGTWCVAMSPSESAELSDADMDAGVFCNCSAFGNPVRTSIFMGGQERAAWMDLLEGNGLHALPDFDPGVTASVLETAKEFILPGVMAGTGPFPHSTSRLVVDGNAAALAALQKDASGSPVMANAARLVSVLSCGLAVQSARQLRQTGAKDGMPIYVEGGFRNNRTYQAVLGSLFPTSPLILTELKEATAFGGALLGLAALRGEDPHALKDAFTIQKASSEETRFEAAKAYAAAFEAAV
jgi:L-fuculokinase